ncbi:MAG: 50S ribosomal protein L25 [Verrucomicrobia bacterium]|nr:50S ribosomal protein L25 [Verrucomicrobiota bacterium]
MEQVALKAEHRKEAGRGPVKRLRTGGVVPGVVYGAHTQPVAVQVKDKDLKKVLHGAAGENVLVELEVSGAGAAEKRLALVREVQHDAMTDRVLHVDFHELKADEKFITTVTVEAVGEAVGVKNGGVLELAMHQLRVRCLPKDLPAKITVDVTALDIGKAVHVAEVKAPAGVELLDRKDLPVALVLAPAVEEEAAPAAEGAVPELEVIKEKKTEGEEAAPAEGAKGKAEGKPAAKAAGKAEGKEAKAEAKPEAKKGK